MLLGLAGAILVLGRGPKLMTLCCSSIPQRRVFEEVFAPGTRFEEVLTSGARFEEVLVPGARFEEVLFRGRVLRRFSSGDAF